MLQSQPTPNDYEAMFQPKPIPNEYEAIQDLVIKDIEKRKEFGILSYGTPLQPFNDRDALVNAYEEALDLSCYLKQLIVEQKIELNGGNHELIFIDKFRYILSQTDYEKFSEYLDDAIAELNTTVDESGNSLAVGVRIGKAINQILKSLELLQKLQQNYGLVVKKEF